MPICSRLFTEKRRRQFFFLFYSTWKDGNAAVQLALVMFTLKTSPVLYNTQAVPLRSTDIENGETPEPASIGCMVVGQFSVPISVNGSWFSGSFFGSKLDSLLSVSTV